MQFVFPIDGDMLNQYDGENRGERLFVKVRAAALPLSELYVNRVKMTEADGCYLAEVPLDGYRNTLVLYNARTFETKEIVVYWLKDSVGKFRLSLDDNIQCLQDLARNASTYRSMFDNAYFALFKKANALYGTKVHMNIYYQTDGFNLTMMPDQYKSEMQENSDWLRFAFHARQNKPDKPYLNTTYDEILRDYRMITDEIRRFAGQDHISSVTTVHWGECTREGVRALRAAGLRCLMGYAIAPENTPRVSYTLDLGQTLNLSERDFWKDQREDMIYGRINKVLNVGPFENIIPDLEIEKQNPSRSGFMELMIHEQYFHSTYPAYLPDYERRVLEPLRWAVENGYKPSWVEDCVLE